MITKESIEADVQREKEGDVVGYPCNPTKCEFCGCMSVSYSTGLCENEDCTEGREIGD